ncbi:MAG: NAD(P)H-hydrate dehydratase [Trueperaceae bacterium]|nr:NAD(P)H-hydrate dehydratase [Trueperaceae bacterium]
MKLFTAEEMRAADQAAMDAGVSSLILMENAGRGIAEFALREWPDLRDAVVLCGKGNNGGDGYTVARYLHQHGWRVRIFEMSDEPGSDDSQTMRSAWLAHSQGCTESLGVEALAKRIDAKTLVVDALFGSGLSRPLEGELANVVKHLNQSDAPVLSVDVPSGISADQPEPIGPAVRATRTVQLAGPKRASAFYPAKSFFSVGAAASQLGRVETVVDVGIPPRLVAAQSSVEVLTPAGVRPYLPTRAPDAHKYQVGTVLVIAGSPQYSGAAQLAARGALRAGAGLVTLAGEEAPGGGWPEIIFAPLDWHNALATLADIPAKRAQVRVIGPGLDPRAFELLPDIIAQREAVTVLDASALTGGEAWFAAVKQHGRCVLTPHVGEASGLLGRAAGDILQDPIGAATALAQNSGAVVVLKGATTVIAAPGGRCAVSAYGHPGMATGGAGDVLSGLLGAWLLGLNNIGTKDSEADEAAIFSRTAACVLAHGLTGERAASAYGDGLTAGDLIDLFPAVWQQLVRGEG